MSLESFFAAEGGEGMSETAFEAFKERMKAAAAQIAAIQREEKKARKKEDELLKILLQFVKNSQKKELVLLISRVLEQNIPANFVLAVILLGNEEIQAQMRSFLMLKSADTQEGVGEGQKDTVEQEKGLIFFRESKTLPLKVRIELDAWVKTLMVQAEEKPQKLLQTSYEIEYVEIESGSPFGDPQYEQKRSIKTPLIQLTTFIVNDFLEAMSVPADFKKSHDFAGFILKGILDKTEESLENRKMLK